MSTYICINFNEQKLNELELMLAMFILVTNYSSSFNFSNAPSVHTHLNVKEYKDK